MYRLLIFLVTLCVHALRAVFRTRGELLIENLALRQQLASLRVLYVFFVIEHGWRRVLNFNATFITKAPWVIQRLREAFPDGTERKYLIFDRDRIFSPAVVHAVKAMRIRPRRIAPFAPDNYPQCLSRRRLDR